MTLLCFS